MAQQTINLGTSPSGQDGDDARTAFEKVNLNFTELYTGVTNAQPLNAKLTAISASVWAANQLMYATGAGTVAMTPFTAAARALLDDADAPAMRVTLGLSGTSLMALNALTPSVNGVPFFNSATTMQAAASTAFGRGLWNLADAAALRTAAALGTSAVLDTASGRQDDTIGRVLRVGDHGVGGAGLPTIAAIDIENLRSNTFCYLAINSGQGSLPVNQNGYLRCATVTSAYAVQDYWPVSAGDQYTRVLNNGTWTAWSKNVRLKDVVGTVSQSGGVPTGAIIERGTTATGEYTKYADGTLDCWYAPGYLTHAANTDLVTGWTFPMPAVSVNTAICSVSVRSPNNTNSFVTNKLQAGMSTTAATFRTQFSAAQDYLLYFTMRGRWY